MKKIIITILLCFMLAGCSNNKDIKQEGCNQLGYYYCSSSYNLLHEAKYNRYDNGRVSCSIWCSAITDSKEIDLPNQGLNTTVLTDNQK